MKRIVKMQRIENNCKKKWKELNRIVRKNGQNWTELKRIDKTLKRIVRKNGKNWKDIEKNCKKNGKNGKELKCTSIFHKRHFRRKFTGKMPSPNLSPERGMSLCASLRSRNACQHVATATLYRNLQEKCRGPAGAPWSSTRL